MNKKTIIGCISIVTISCSLLLGLVLTREIQNKLTDNLINQFGKQELSLAQGTAKVIEIKIKNIQQQLKYIAKVSDIRNGSAELCNDKVDELIKTVNDPLKNLIRVSKDGMIDCSVQRDSIGTAINKFGDYFEVLKNDPLHEPVLSRMIFPKDSKSFVFAIHVPIFDNNGGFNGSLGGAITFDALQDNYLSEIRFSKSGYATLIDDNGDIMYHPKTELVGQNIDSDAVQNLIGRNQELNKSLKDAEQGNDSIVKYTFDGSTRIAALGPVTLSKNRHWVVNITTPQKDVQDTVNSLGISSLFSWLLLIQIIGIVFTPLIILAYLVKAVFNPISKITKSITKISEGTLNERLPNVDNTSQDELVQLTKAFNVMASKLQDSYGSLEAKVTEKTKDLQHAITLVEIEKAKDEALFASIGEGVIGLDLNGHINAINAMAENMLNVTHDQIFGKSWRSYNETSYDETGTKVPETDLIFNTVIRTKTKAVVKRTYHKPNGENFFVKLTGTPIVSNSEITGVVLVLENITREMEIDRAKTEFVSLASHQLRTPLSSINWYSEALLDDPRIQPLSDDVLYIKEIYTASKRMVSLVRALLNVSRFELGMFQMNLQTVDLRATVESVLDELEQMITTKKITIYNNTSKDIPSFEGDEDLIRIIFQNLLSNAIKYTPNEGRVDLTLDLDNSNKETPRIHLEVKDTGWGIPLSQQSKVYQKLFRADNITQKETDGTGLGLYLVKSILNACGGTIDFVSKENHGTTFTVSIPLDGMIKSAKKEQG